MYKEAAGKDGDFMNIAIVDDAQMKRRHLYISSKNMALLTE